MTAAPDPLYPRIFDPLARFAKAKQRLDAAQKAFQVAAEELANADRDYGLSYHEYLTYLGK